MFIMKLNLCKGAWASVTQAFNDNDFDSLRLMYSHALPHFRFKPKGWRADLSRNMKGGGTKRFAFQIRK